MIRVKNRGYLADSAKVVSLLERAAAAVLEGEKLQWLETAQEDAYELPGWVMFSDKRGRGVGMNTAGSVPSVTPLRKRIDYARCAQMLSAFIQVASPEDPLYLLEAPGCPIDWRAYRVSARSRSFLCAASAPIPNFLGNLEKSVSAAPRIIVPIVASLFLSQEPVVGCSQWYQTLQAAIPALNMTCLVDISREGMMKLEIVAEDKALRDEDMRLLSVTVELGELELSLSEIVGLRPGSVLELDVEMPINVQMRIGSSALAKGILEKRQGGCMLVVQEIL